MSFLKKILLIAIISVFTGNAEGLIIFNLPDNTPGLKGINPTFPIRLKINNIQDSECLHVIVPNSPADEMLMVTKGLNAKEQYDSVIASKGNIYFPCNGVQPTTPEAVEYSCANVDAGVENSPITEWYMRMFGWIPEDDTQVGAEHDHKDRLKIGFKKCNQAVPIIILHNAGISNDNTTLFTPNGVLTKKQSFWYFFRQVASNPVGRILLYRILIEIRRETVDNCCISISSQQVNAMRNYNRKLQIEWSQDNRFGYCPAGNPVLGFGENAALVFNSEIFASPGVKSSCIGQQINEDSVAIVSRDTSCAIGIYHELNHWYHLLRYPKRYIDERRAKNGTVPLNGRDVNGIQQISLGGLYWPYDNNDAQFAGNWRISALPWLTPDNTYINFEEIRNILGSQADKISDYKEGDDLSENLYRASIGYPLRFGHDGSISYWEDTEVINKVKQVCGRAINNHGWMYDFVSSEGMMPFSDKVQDLIRGIGGCVHVKPVLKLAGIRPRGMI